ncbi:BPL-N domain-containing protein [Pantoea agglomerans]|uniref:BPL-N domain-containing protein n=2 Tax=Enterobacter agglomerans TaxID=549 RepID=UPI003C7E7884
MKRKKEISGKNFCMFVLTSVFPFISMVYVHEAHAFDTKTVNIAIYRGSAGCKGCSEMVAKSLRETGLNLSISYIGEKETLKINDKNLKKFELYIQPGGGQDIPAAYNAIGDDSADAIRRFVNSGKNYLGICMGAYLADRDWIGLINSQLNSEVGRPGSDASDEGDYTFSISWDDKKESVYYQDGPYFENSSLSSGFKPIAYYNNKDVAMAAYSYGKGKVVLTGPHLEADESWINTNEPGYIPARNKMKRLLEYFHIING